MSRSIFQRGAEWPSNIQAVTTFDTSISYDGSKPQGGLDWQVFRHHCFPWLSTADETDIELRDSREFLMTIPDTNGEEKPVRIIPHPPQLQTSINNEMSAIVWRQDWATYGLPDLARVTTENGIDFIRLEAHETPLSQADNFTTQRDAFIVKSIDSANNTLTIEGQKYYRKRSTSAKTPLGQNIYSIGSHWGFQRYMRDQLTTDDERNIDEFKVHEYEYAFMQWSGSTYRYNNVTDMPAHDYTAIIYSDLVSLINSTNPDGSSRFFRFTAVSDTGSASVEFTDSSQSVFDLSLLLVNNQNLLNELASLSQLERMNQSFMTTKIADIESREVAPSEHKIHFQIFPTGISVGDSITMVRRLPYVTTMLSTMGTFSQKGGYWDFRIRFDRKKRQFSAAFLWTNYLETLIRRFLQYLKEMEIDVKEWPAGTTPFMNTHRPIGGMYNYAETQGREPVMSHPEWSEDNKQQHQLLIPASSDDYVDSGAWHDVRVAVCLEGNPLGFPANSVVWYERTGDGKFKFTAGCLLSPEAHNNVLDHLQCFLVNAVDGDFVADMEYFAPGQASTDETLPITFDIAQVKASQFRGFEAGGAGFPDASGQMPAGTTVTPNDTTTNSGGGVVGVPVNTSTTQVIVSGYEVAKIRNDGGRLLIPVIE